MGDRESFRTGISQQQHEAEAALVRAMSAQGLEMWSPQRPCQPVRSGRSIQERLGRVGTDVPVGGIPPDRRPRRRLLDHGVRRNRRHGLDGRVRALHRVNGWRASHPPHAPGHTRLSSRGRRVEGRSRAQQLRARRLIRSSKASDSIYHRLTTGFRGSCSLRSRTDVHEGALPGSPELRPCRDFADQAEADLPARYLSGVWAAETPRNIISAEVLILLAGSPPNDFRDY